MCGIHIGVSYLKAGRSLALPLFERRSVLRRILLVLTVAALMAAMMVSAGPAQANDLNLGNSSNFVQVGDSLFGVGDIDDFDDNGIDFDGIGFDDNGIDFDGIDFDSNGGFFGFGGGIQQDSDSGELSIGSDVS
jgi:hypothetical protein